MDKELFLDNTNDIAKVILAKRYLKKDEDGNIIETEAGMYERVATAIASPEQKNKKGWFKKYYEMLYNKLFMPNTPALINASQEKTGQLAACFVLPIEDSLEGILKSAVDAARIHASGGGVGYSFTRLRPNGDIIMKSKGVTPGPVAFMRMYDAMTGVISQGGTRRGANLGVLNVNHPDIEEFIDCKTSGGLTNFNISVGIIDGFFDAVINKGTIDLINPRTGKLSKTLEAEYIFNKIANAAWSVGDPGLLFLDTINDGNPLKEHEVIEACNPCGEQPLPPYGSCILGHINLVKYCEMSKQEKEELVYNAVRFLDNLITINKYPIHELAEYANKSRRIGLGVMGLADVLAANRIRYGSQESIAFISSLFEEIYEYADAASKAIGDELGYCLYKKRRNSSLMSVAPTGTVSTICNVNYGIEPFYSLSYTRKILDGTVFNEVVAPLSSLPDIVKNEVIKNNGRIYGTKFEKEYAHLITAHDITYQEHINVQAAAQKHIDGAISKTINMKNTVSVDDVKNAYILAYQSGCKGITIYRDGCKSGQVLS